MITLRTTSQFQIPFGRTIRVETVYLTIERLEMDINNVSPEGFYYFIDENGEVQKLDDIKRHPKLWSNIEIAEEVLLSPMSSTVHLKENVIERLTQFVLIQLEQEEGLNYNTTASDWELI